MRATITEQREISARRTAAAAAAVAEIREIVLRGKESHVAIAGEFRIIRFFGARDYRESVGSAVDVERRAQLYRYTTRRAGRRDEG